MTGKFVGKLRVEYINGVQWKVINPVDSSDRFGFVLDDGRAIYPTDGMITDFASVPKALQNILPASGDGDDGEYGLGAVIHDLLYETGKIDGVDITQHEADDVLEACCEAKDVDWWKTRAIREALREFGYIAWNEHREKDALSEMVLMPT